VCVYINIVYGLLVLVLIIRPRWEIRMQAEIAMRPIVPLDVAPGSSETLLCWNRSLARRSRGH
jgi:hypothetical protein